MKYLLLALLLSACSSAEPTTTTEPTDAATETAPYDQPCNGSICSCSGCIYDGIQQAWIGCRPNVIENCVTVDGGSK